MKNIIYSVLSLFIITIAPTRDAMCEDFALFANLGTYIYNTTELNRMFDVDYKMCSDTEDNTRFSKIVRDDLCFIYLDGKKENGGDTCLNRLQSAMFDDLFLTQTKSFENLTETAQRLEKYMTYLRDGGEIENPEETIKNMNFNQTEMKTIAKAMRDDGIMNGEGEEDEGREMTPAESEAYWNKMKDDLIEMLADRNYQSVDYQPHLRNTLLTLLADRKAKIAKLGDGEMFKIAQNKISLNIQELGKACASTTVDDMLTAYRKKRSLTKDSEGFFRTVGLRTDKNVHSISKIPGFEDVGARVVDAYRMYTTKTYPVTTN
jgi:hypothetical protein